MRDEERYSSSRPLKEFHGNEDDYPDWETDFETWSGRKEAKTRQRKQHHGQQLQ